MTSDEPQMLRHLPFFEELSSLDDQSPAWREASAGLLVLRLVDSWLEDGASAVRGGWGVRAVRECIDAIAPGTPVRAILSGILEGMSDATDVEPRIVTPRLMAYGQALSLDAHYALAADVFETIVAHAHPLEEHDLVTDAYLLLGASRRTLGRFDDAAVAYALAGDVAATANDIARVLRVRIADAKLSMERGNLPDAERVLEETIGHAAAAGEHEVEALARHQRATVAIERGDYELAIREGYRAFGHLPSANARDRALGDIAAAFAELGCRSAARDANLILAATAQELHTRWVATINLMEIAFLDGREPVFEQYRRELADASLPPMLGAFYHLYVGRGMQMFGRVDGARREMARALEIAEVHGLNKIVFEAERSLQALDRAAREAARVASDPPPSVVEVADRLRALRTQAGL